MILITPEKLEGTRFRYRIQEDNRLPTTFEKEEEVVTFLKMRGVDYPANLIAHARAWGRVKVHEHK